MTQITMERKQTSEEKMANCGPYTSLFRETLQHAQKQSASDIHIEPHANGLAIRIRVNGDLFTHKTLTRDYRQSFIQETKRLCNLSIAISNRPQDSRLSLPSWKLALRVNSTPTLYGEKIVLRLLDMTTDFNLESSNLSDDAVFDLRNSANEPNGVILVSGPTGSGKTRTLFSLLNSLDKERKNIVSLEDPVEYSFQGINQIEIKDSLSFADGLRAVLRQDPDIIFVGEIRDWETADLCFKASATGHLVISTLHANSAVKVIERLRNMGVEPYMLESNLRFCAVQRLVKKICPFCSNRVTSQDVRKIHALAPLALKGDFRQINSKGCQRCKKGVVGRIPVMEYLTKSELAQPKSLKPKKSLLDEYVSKAQNSLIDYQEVLNCE